MNSTTNNQTEPREDVFDSQEFLGGLDNNGHPQSL
jgi:hypothetical protein